MLLRDSLGLVVVDFLRAEQRFAGRTAVVTGAARGIGEAVARGLALEGADVVLADIDQRAQEVAETLVAEGHSAVWIECDVANEMNVAETMDRAAQLYGAPSVVVSNAGVSEVKKPLHEIDMTMWGHVMDVNLNGTALTLKYALRQMVDDPSGGDRAVVAMSSILGLVGQSESGPYSAAKAGVANLVRSAGVTYAAQGIRVNAVAPGYVETDLTRQLSPTVMRRVTDRQPIGRLGTVREVSEVVLFLASEAASFVTGVVWPVDGGYTAV